MGIFNLGFGNPIGVTNAQNRWRKTAAAPMPPYEKIQNPAATQSEYQLISIISTALVQLMKLVINEQIEMFL